MKIETKTKNNPHTWFFAYVNNLEQYDKEYAKVIREGIVFDYSKGKTASLSELYENDRSTYIRMKNELCKSEVQAADQARKRLIAVLFSYLQYHGHGSNMEYVKAVACRAAGVSNFNDIPSTKLKELYRIFGEKRSKDAEKWTNEVLTNVTDDYEADDIHASGK